MSLATEQMLSDVQGKFAGGRCFVVGCGPSLDNVNLKSLNGEVVFALNAAVTLFGKKNCPRQLWWVFRDVRVVYECLDRMPNVEKLRVVATSKGVRRFRDNVKPMLFKAINCYAFQPERVIHRRTVVEDALQIVRDLGFSECYLVGIDHVVRDGQPYAKALSWKECYFYRGNPKARGIHELTAHVAAIEALKTSLGNLKVWNTSPIYPRPVFEQVELSAVVGSGSPAAV